MPFDPHVATLAVVTLAAGWLMTQAGIQKGALERRRTRRKCPSCGRQIQARVCQSCAAR